MREERAQSRAAAELLQLASADDGGAPGDGTIGYEAFMAFQRRVGLLQAISAVDQQQAHALEEQHAAAAGAAQHLGGGQAGAAGGSMDEGSLFCDPPSAAGLAWASGSFDGGDAPAGGSSSRVAARAIACRAQSSGAPHRSAAALRWRPPGQAACHQRGTVLVRATSVGTASSSSSSCSSSDSADFDAEAVSSSGAAHLDGSVRNSAVAMRVGSSSSAPASSSAAASSDNGNGSANGSSGAADQALLQKPERRPPPQRDAADEPDAATTSQRDAAAVWKASRAVQGIVRLVSGGGPPPADAAWQLVAAPCNPHRVLDAAGEALPAAASGGDHGTQALRVPEQGPCVVGAVLDR